MAKPGREPHRSVLGYVRSGSTGPAQPAGRIVSRRWSERYRSDLSAPAAAAADTATKPTTGGAAEATAEAATRRTAETAATGSSVPAAAAARGAAETATAGRAVPATATGSA